MGLLDSLKRVFAGSASKPASAAPAPAASRPEPKEIRVPEVTATELMAARRDGAAPFLIDCREAYERQQGYIPGSTHIIMREIPDRLNELSRDSDLIVYCAHGNRSYGVAGYLIENGFRARSLKGGIVEWRARGGEVTRNPEPQAA